MSDIDTNECGAGRVMYRDNESWKTPCPIPPTTGLLALGDAATDDQFIPLCSYHMRLVDTDLSEFCLSANLTRTRHAPVETIQLPPLPPQESACPSSNDGDGGSGRTDTRP